MITLLEQITEENVVAFKEVRLAALQDSPTAFESVYANELLIPHEKWIERARNWGGPKSRAFLANDNGDYCGIAAGTIDPSDATQAYLLSMWVMPSYRQRGVGRVLVNAVVGWAGTTAARKVVLDVTANNDGAIAFYERLGFVKTGKTKPYPHDPTLSELEMMRALRGD